ncbi:MAG: hypothetical protein CIT01_00655 [Methanobacterium sp. BRmetb2]|nr:MAG: hypothetical protein CIT01_00655 [Methanobacterium sp. BRmetb2]
MNYNDLTDNLKIGRRELDGVNGVKILDDWKWDFNLTIWYIEIEITSDISGNIPTKSTWYVIAEKSYPKGIVKIYPAKNNFNLTFEHQSNNGLEENNLWRKGSLCLESPLKCLGKHDFDSEPLTAEDRLLWNVKRAIDWINAANKNELTKDDYYFELPQFNESLTYFAFSEDEKSFNDWKKIKNTFGIAELDLYKSKPPVYFIKKFKNENNKTIRKVRWGKYLSQEFEKPNVALWVMLKKTPVINRWQAPNLFGELFDACRKQNIDLRSIVKWLAHNIRDGKHHLLLLGFPIPTTIGGENTIIHWQALKLPILSPSNLKELNPYDHTARKKIKKSKPKHNAKGVRAHEKALWNLDRTILTSKKKIEWLKSQNWNKQEIHNRGQLSEDLTSMNILIIGAGTIGSSIAELLVRSGISNLSIIDADTLKIGNLSRHSLGLTQIGKTKSNEISLYLNQINPNTTVEVIDNNFEFSVAFSKNIENFDMIIDCTGEDIVLEDLEKFKFQNNKIFISIFIGFAAKRLYMYLQIGNKFKTDDFCKKTLFWQEKERKEFSSYKLPREGTGCWSSVFPARYDDILLASSTAIKIIEDFIKNKHITSLICIYEQYSDSDGIFIGYKKVEKV